MLIWRRGRHTPHPQLINVFSPGRGGRAEAESGEGGREGGPPAQLLLRLPGLIRVHVRPLGTATNFEAEGVVWLGEGGGGTLGCAGNPSMNVGQRAGFAFVTQRGRTGGADRQRGRDPSASCMLTESAFSVPACKDKRGKTQGCAHQYGHGQ